MKTKNIIKLIVSIVMPLLAGFIGSMYTMPNITSWYAYLVKPDFAPPNWIFGPVWTTLYILMGISLYLVWKNGFGKENVRLAILMFGYQIILNTLWSYLFFGLQNMLFGLIGIIVLWYAILVNMTMFARVSRKAAAFFLPYLVWVTFAGYINYILLTLNV